MWYYTFSGIAKDFLKGNGFFFHKICVISQRAGAAMEMWEMHIKKAGRKYKIFCDFLFFNTPLQSK